MFFFGGIDLNRVPKTIQDNQQSSSARPRHINLFFQFLLSCMIRNLSHKQNRNKNLKTSCALRPIHIPRYRFEASSGGLMVHRTASGWELICGPNDIVVCFCEKTQKMRIFRDEEHRYERIPSHSFVCATFWQNNFYKMIVTFVWYNNNNKSEIIERLWQQQST